MASPPKKKAMGRELGLRKYSL